MMKMTGRARLRSFLLVQLALMSALVVVSGVFARAKDKAPPSPEQQKLDAILAKFDETQSSTQTLTASFTERKEIALLKEPVVAKGRFFYTKPDDVLRSEERRV